MCERPKKCLELKSVRARLIPKVPFYKMSKIKVIPSKIELDLKSLLFVSPTNNAPWKTSPKIWQPTK